MLPNILPVALIFGVWGWISGEVNLAATTVLSVALGIVVDDTTHIMMKHRRLVAKGYDAAEASRLTIVHAGPPIIVTTIILTCGFLILGFSDFALTSQQSLMIAASICIAVIFDLTVTPVMLTLGKRRTSR
jgi:predicted RND superfamily exporter protein